MIEVILTEEQVDRIWLAMSEMIFMEVILEENGLEVPESVDDVMSNCVIKVANELGCTDMGEIKSRISECSDILIEEFDKKVAEEVEKEMLEGDKSNEPVEGLLKEGDTSEPK